MKKLLTMILTLAISITTMNISSFSAKAEDNDNLILSEDEAQQNEKSFTPQVGNEKKRAILVVSFGTSYDISREKTIGAIEKAIEEAYPAYEVRRAFTSQTIISKLFQNNIYIDNVQQAMERLVADGFGTVICQPTHIVNGLEYDEMIAQIKPFKSNFEHLEFGTPLLTSSEDYQDVVKAIKKEMNIDPKDALVLMGHGTEHYSNAAYGALDYAFKDDEQKNVFVGTIEAYPGIKSVIKGVRRFNPRKVYLAPFMITSGDHANNDMAGKSENSWETMLKNEGFKVETILKGLGEYKSIRDIYVKHVGEAIKSVEG